MEAEDDDIIEFFAEPEMLQTKALEKIKTHFVFINFFLRNSHGLWGNAGKHCTAGQANDYNTAHAQLHARYLRLQTHTHNM